MPLIMAYFANGKTHISTNFRNITSSFTAQFFAVADFSSSLFTLNIKTMSNCVYSFHENILTKIVKKVMVFKIFVLMCLVAWNPYIA